MYPSGSGRHVVYAVHFVLFASAYKESHSSPDKGALDTAPSLPGYLVLRPPDSLARCPFCFPQSKELETPAQVVCFLSAGFCVCLLEERKNSESVHLWILFLNHPVLQSCETL